MKFDALKEGLTLAFILDQRFAEIGAQSDRPLAGVIHDLETFDNFAEFVERVVAPPFCYRFLQECRSNLDQLRGKIE